MSERKGHGEGRAAPLTFDGTDPPIPIRGDQVLRKLARLIGRQMAREQFESSQSARGLGHLAEKNQSPLAGSTKPGARHLFALVGNVCGCRAI